MGISPTIFTGSAQAAVCAMRQGKLTAQAYAKHFLDRLEAQEAQVRALAYWDRAQVQVQAARIDTQKPLAGIPIAIKDVLDVRDMPTAYGAQAVFHHHPAEDAQCVARLRNAGAIIMGKATTAEFAYAQPPATRHPCDLRRTPGGSSSGSAAGVAAGFFPLSIGTQTGGSIIRPASFCGVYGFKPTFGRLGRQGLALFAESFDTVGWFARYLEDITLLYTVLIGEGGADASSLGRPKERSIPTTPAAQRPPRILFYPGPFWSQASTPMQTLLRAGADLLQAQSCTLPIDMRQVSELHRLLMAVEMAQARQAWLPHYLPQMSTSLQQLIKTGQQADPALVQSAYRDLAEARVQMDAWFEHEEVDVILAPAAPGEAPKTHQHTGSSIFNGYWSALHVPCVSLPIGHGPNGMPLGVQLIARRQHDAQLLGWAEYVRTQLQPLSTATDL